MSLRTILWYIYKIPAQLEWWISRGVPEETQEEYDDRQW